MNSDSVMTIDEFVQRKVDEVSRRKGVSRKVAAQRLRFAAEALLDQMQIGEQEAFPIPSNKKESGKPRTFVITKHGKRKLQISNK
jgi:hypothetical protein